jgi:hypothetical protein
VVFVVDKVGLDSLNIFLRRFLIPGSVDSLTHGAEPFLRSCQLCSYSRTFQHFMKPEGSLPCSQEPSTCPYPEPHQSNSYHLSKVHFNIVHPSTSWSSQWYLTFWLFHQYYICIPFLPTRATFSARLILLDLVILMILREEYKL